MKEPLTAKPKSHLASLFKLAWRNIWRQKRRTTLLIVVVAYAVLATIFFWGFNDGFNSSILTGQARYLVAPMMVMSEDYNRDPSAENALPTLDIISDIAKVSGVSAVAPRLEFPGLLRSPYTSEGARLRGIDPALESKVSAIPENIAKGRMLTQTGEVVLGINVAERLDVRLDERLAIDASALAGTQGLGLNVVGFIETGLAAVDNNMVFIHIDDARFLTGVSTATGLALDIDKSQEATIQTNVQAVLPEKIKAYDLLSLLGAVAMRVKVSRLMMLPIGLLFAIFAALAVTSTLLVSVMERGKEFGMVAAIGLAPPKLAVMVVLETMLTTFFGWLLGLLVGYGVVFFLSIQNVLGPVFASAAKSLGDFGIGEEIYTNVSINYALYATVTVLLAAIFAILFPARRVSRLNPVDAMREN